MAEITKIPFDELTQDRGESFADASFCAIALSYDIQMINGRSVVERLQANMRIVDAIDRELERRAAVNLGS